MRDQIQNNINEYIALFLIISIILFFILREIYCWYFKINDIILRMDRQEKLIDDKLSELNNQISFIIEFGLSIRPQIDEIEPEYEFTSEPLKMMDSKNIDTNLNIVTNQAEKMKIERDLSIDNNAEEQIVNKEKASFKQILTKKYYIRDFFK